MNTNSHFPSSSRKHKILLVDDHPLVRRGLAELLSREPDLEICGEADDVNGGFKAANTCSPELIILDLSLKNSHGIELIKQLKEAELNIKILVSSMHDEMLFAERVLRAGAMGYITKEESTEVLLTAIRQILRGEVYLSSRMTNRLLNRVASGTSALNNPIESLSNRELEVFEMLGQGLTTQQIAQKLEISPKTVETHREKIKQKLNLKNSTELNRRAVQWVLERE